MTESDKLLLDRTPTPHSLLAACLWSITSHEDASTDLPVAQVSLVSQHDEGEAGWVLRFGLDQKLLPPALQGRETGSGCDIEHQYAAVGSSVERSAQRLEPLRPRCVPHLRDICVLVL